ncbi:pleckstrin homology domain-containing family G member 3-like [Brachionichthys hirsutus]|uniref:pleckstrin homology domain-containing family G member 3-like n=1 Tax=Brachionichthys hirsutus TaxID=412623 RepID=UPI003604A259
MPEGSRSAVHQGPMGEESPQFSSPLSSSDHDQANLDFGPDCFGQLYEARLEAEGERPVSLVSTLSSGSSRDSRSLFGSTVALPSSATPPISGEEDIDLELSPAEGAGEKLGGQSPNLSGSRCRWLEPRLISNRWNSDVASDKKASGEAPHVPTSPVVTDTMAPNPKLTYLDRVVMEIIETERMYVKDLRSIVEDYLAHIIDRSDLPIQPEQVCGLFGNIEDIYVFNSELLQSLDGCESDPVAIARCFVDKSEYFEIYTQYCTNYPNSVAALTDCMRRKTLAKFFRDRQAALKRYLPLGSYLLKPVQRILKYHLLLQEIAKHFDSDEEGYEVIQEAIDTMTGVAWYINDMKRKHEHAVKVQEIQSLLINWKGPDLTTYGELVLEGTFHVLRAKNTRTLFLFERMLLITKKRGEHYVYKSHISCATLMLLDSAKDPLLFSVIHFKRPKQPHTVQAKSVEEKRLWFHHIKRLILENHSTIIPQKAIEATMDSSNYLGKYHYSPERLKKAESADDFHVGGRNERRRRSEPAKQITRTTKAVLKHADSEGALLGERCPQPAGVGTRTASLDEPQVERPGVDDLIPSGDSLEQLSPTGSDLRVGSSPSEGGLALEEDEKEGESYEEDALMGDDQVADFANSVLAAISCWHYKARALLSTRFTTDDRSRDSETPQREEEDSCRQEAAKESLASKAGEEERCPLETFPQLGSNGDQQQVHPSQQPGSPLSSWPQEDTTPEPHDSPRETAEEEEESDSSGLQVEGTSMLMNGEHSEEEEEVLPGSNGVLPSSECFISSLSRRSSLVLEDLCSMTCSSPSVDHDVFKSPLACMDLERPTQMLASSPPELRAVSPILSTPAHEPELSALIEGELKSTLSRQDRLLIHKIRRYYEHAEHQDANFSVKRRESLSYIPAGLVQHLSRQLNSGPQEQAVSLNRKSPARNRPTSWSVFDLPGLEKSHDSDEKTEPQRQLETKFRAQSVMNVSTTEEELWPMSDMLKVWQGMKVEENQEVSQTLEEELNASRSEPVQDIGSDVSDINTSKNHPPALMASEKGALSDDPTSNVSVSEAVPCQDSKIPTPQENNHLNHGHLPKAISFRTSMEEDQILQDMGKMKNKVLQLARQYSQRIKNNRPMAWQKNRETANQGFKNMPSVQEEKMGKPNLRLALNVCDQLNIQEEASSSPVQTPSSPPADGFSWPVVQELRTKYTSHSSELPRSRADPDGMLDCCTNGCNGFFPEYHGSPGHHRAPADRPTAHKEQSPAMEDGPQPRLRPLLCRWSSLDHMLGSLPLRDVDFLQGCVRTGNTTGQASPIREPGKLRDEEKVLQEAPDCLSKAAAPKTTDSHLVKSLRDKFQSLSSTS